MSDSLHPLYGGTPVPPDESPDAAFDALANRRRREILAVLVGRLLRFEPDGTTGTVFDEVPR